MGTSERPASDTDAPTIRRLTPTEVFFIAREVLAGIHELHALGIVHFDIKPHNVVWVQSHKYYGFSPRLYV